MDSKFFNIPFRSPSSDSDFICKDGEIESWKGAKNENWKAEGIAPTPEIEFGIVRDVLKGWHIHPDDYPAKTMVATDPSMEYWNKMGAQLLAQFQSEATWQNLFVAPFYVMAAWKTYSGTYLSSTSPVLMIPNSSVPLVATDDDISSKELEFKIAAAVCRLYYKLKSPEVLRDWVGIIESLEILVSEPLYSYDTFHAFIPSKHVATENYCICLDLASGEISQSRICTQTLPLAWKANMEIREKELNPETKFYPFASLPLSGMAPDDDGDKYRAASGEYGGSIKYGAVNREWGVSSKSEPFIIEGKGAEVRVVTRPIKLENAGKLKMVRQIYLRGNYTPENMAITVYGSRDMLQWWCIAKRKGGTAVSLPRSSFRFYRLEITGFLSESENLQGISL